MRLRDGVVFSEIEREAVIIDTNRGRYLSLNESGSRVLHMLLGAKNLREVVRKVIVETEADPATVEADVTMFRDKLLNEGIIETSEREV